MGSAREVVERMATLFDEGDVAGSVGCFSADAVFVNPLTTVRGADEISELFSAFASAFTDLRHNVSFGFEADDLVALEGAVTGTHTGTLAAPTGEIPATGRSIDYRFAVIARVTDGKIAEMRSYWDVAQFMTQLGLMPERAAATA
jgi:steroid delta-isomerase-like uncharacterized protein